jgi:hypothetical protein
LLCPLRGGEPHPFRQMDRSDHVAGVFAEMLEPQSGPGKKRPPQWAGVGKLWEAFQALSQSASQTHSTPLWAEALAMVAGRGGVSRASDAHQLVEGLVLGPRVDNLQPGDETRIRAVLAEQQKTVGGGLSMVGASRFPPIRADKPHIDDSRYLSLLSTPLGQAKSILAVTSAVGSHWTASIWWSCCRPSSPRPGILTRRCHADSCTTARGGGPWRPPGSVVHLR